MKTMEDLAFSAENIQRIAMVENCFGVSGKRLAKEGRILVGEGVLKKECRKKVKLRVFFLFSDILVYGNIVVMNKKYNNQHIIPLEGLHIESLEDQNEMQNRWMIKSERKSFVVSTPTPFQKNEWMQHIEYCIKHLMIKPGNTLTKEHAAPWIPDHATDICMRCTSTKFNFIERRHHCRYCGYVVCGQCSKQNFLFPNMSKKPQRICLLCYKLLSADERKQTLERITPMKETVHHDVYNEHSSGDEDSIKGNEDDLFKDWQSNEDINLSVVLQSSFHNKNCQF
ncbi:pleckstrin homology domain-containing family F member 2-like [Protopterus annectens]|uniref:pleckstrin homology domain-containing family F member 2-like n=1 Tax=Protopterus annectens TaxID=7888 RepID=UPI001CF9D9AE|nr:pleckstrin homology domain-containing family F member 2-like [Protopterus annectens]XP_043937602.1 pleckstrin homology domain-containing family F member 2-like [Protopterus annectens]